MATNYWLGGAVAVPEVKTYIFAGTWLVGDTAWIQINGKRLTLTAGTVITATAMAADMIDMINGAAVNQDEARSALGTAVGEFCGLTASAGSAGQVKITGASTGRPIGTVTCGEVTAGDGTFAAVGGAPDVTGTGPYHHSNVANWSLGAAPVDTNDVVFDHQAANSCLYDLTPSSITPASLRITKGFKYAIGLPEVNRDSATYPYAEHQSTYLVYDGVTVVNIDASSAQMVKLDCGAVDSAINVTGTGSTTEVGTPPVLLKGSAANNTLTVSSGSVGYCYESITAGTLLTCSVGGGQNPSLEIGTTVTVGTINQSSGTILCRTSVTVTALTVTGGTFTHAGATITTANILGGTLVKNAAFTITTLYLATGILDGTKDPRALTITNCHVYPGSSLKDPLGVNVYSNGIKLYCKLSEVSLDLPARRTYTLAAI